jgi:hypothetical protein
VLWNFLCVADGGCGQREAIRAAEGLPSQSSGLVLACFNQHFKIDPQVSTGATPLSLPFFCRPSYAPRPAHLFESDP